MAPFVGYNTHVTGRQYFTTSEGLFHQRIVIAEHGGSGGGWDPNETVTLIPKSTPNRSGV